MFYILHAHLPILNTEIPQFSSSSTDRFLSSTLYAKSTELGFVNSMRCRGASAGEDGTGWGKGEGWDGTGRNGVRGGVGRDG